jgi:hypothetical protein
MRYVFIVLGLLLCPVASADVQMSIGIGLPGVRIGINLPLFPELVRVPGYPVYYAPRLNSNYFFYDGMYWLYRGDNWYASSWYNGPWGVVAPEVVPLYVLRIPVRYYRSPPAYFRGWGSEAPPRWGEHWGHEWAQHRSGWDRWNHSSAPAPAPLPLYQRQYSGDRYPRLEQQQALHSQNYRYQPHDAVVRQHYQEHAVQRAPAPFQREQRGAPQDRSARQQDLQRSNPPPPLQQGGPAVARSQPLQRGGDQFQRSAPTQAPPQPRSPAFHDQRQQPQLHPQPQQGTALREQQKPRPSQQVIPPGKGASPEPRRVQGEERGREHNR